MEVVESTVRENMIESEPNTSNVTMSNEHEKLESDATPIEDEVKAIQIENVDKSEDDHRTTDTNVFEKPKELSFKKPALLIGPRKGRPGKLRTLPKVVDPDSLPNTLETNLPHDPQENENIPDTTISETEESPAIVSEREKSRNVEESKEKQIVFPYKEPPWGGLPDHPYKLEVLKSGVILEEVNLNDKSFHVLGRLPTCDVPLAHPTISRYHAIIQYRSIGDTTNPKGLYLYDLGSTHGSFWNGYRVKPNMYVRLRTGHMIRFGCSQRKFIVYGPTEDEEEETDLTLTELKEQRRVELEERERAMRELKLREEEEERLRKEKEETEGIDWGMGEDADEETDLSENPYAATNNEELFLNDPKKTLRGWFEREGFDLQYQTEEKGIGQFLCWVELPIDTATGKSVRAEALVKGKKKESVVQCALEACRILDRHGVLRQAHHEARKRKVKNWEDEDFYDSDEDNFLDRTGAIEKKRLQRMRQAGKIEEAVETYSTLMEKHQTVIKQIASIDADLQKARDMKNMQNEDSDEDALDSFMSNLKSAVPTKHQIMKMKSDLQTLRKEESRLIALVNIARPADLPALKQQTVEKPILKTNQPDIKPLPVIGDKKQIKIVKKSQDESRTSEKKEQSNADMIQAYKSRLMENDELDTVEDEKNKSSSQSEKINKRESSLVSDDVDEVERQKKRKKNQKRLQHRLDKAEKSKERGYESDMYKEDYSMWVPPENQSGDGKTKLNDKFGY